MMGLLEPFNVIKQTNVARNMNDFKSADKNYIG